MSDFRKNSTVTGKLYRENIVKNVTIKRKKKKEHVYFCNSELFGLIQPEGRVADFLGLKYTCSFFFLTCIRTGLTLYYPATDLQVQTNTVESDLFIGRHVNPVARVNVGIKRFCEPWIC